MINPEYYNDSNVEALYGNGKINHYLIRKPTVVLQSYRYSIKEGETMYSIANRLFGDTYRWTIIAEINHLKKPDEWKAGQIINLPYLILQDIVPLKFTYAGAESRSTVL